MADNQKKSKQASTNKQEMQTDPKEETTSSEDQNHSQTLTTTELDSTQEVSSDKVSGKERYVCRLRGLPWSAREKEINEFFKDEKIVEVQIVFLRDGKASGMTGEALVEFQSSSDFQSAFLKNRCHLGHRYVEIFSATGEEIDAAAGRIAKVPLRAPKTQYVVRMRGLPYEATETDVKKFFTPLRIVGVHLVKDELGRPSGEGFVEFSNESDMITAMTKHRQNMGRRYIELFRSAPDELTKILGFGHKLNAYGQKMFGAEKSNPLSKSYDVNGVQESICLLMRGLPYSCTEADITKFFQEVQITPVRIHRKADGAEAFVEFYSIADCSKAMSRHRNFIGPRYIELFRVSYETMAQTVGLPVLRQALINTTSAQF